MRIKTKFTLHSNLPASQELFTITKALCHTDRKSFIGTLNAWLIKERVVDCDGKTHYVRKNTHSACQSFKRDMPWLWA
ncbi:hypothetical protein [Hoylesella oralis]|uniref:hypothetical protein n=1 Tax=Hoylesella oralis TaxID=28134 RepID=UPI0028E1E072|nr:hypothetical protein [Hoylesella oralis]